MKSIQINYQEFKECQWTNTDTGEVIIYNEKTEQIIMMADAKIKIDRFHYKYSKHILHCCNIAISEDHNSIMVSLSFQSEVKILNTLFLSVVLTELLNKHK